MRVATQEPDPAAAELASSLLLGAHDGFVDSGGVRIHYVSLGRPQDPLLVLIHGFPDFWYSWREQMPALSKWFHVVAIDQRGYNLSGQPEGVSNYAIDKLVGDLVAVVKHFGRGKAVIVGHDWGGLVAWTFAMTHPELTDRLIVLNLPHPRGIMRELATNPNQQRNSQYARDFQRPDAAKRMSVDFLSMWVKDPAAQDLPGGLEAVIDGRDAQLLQGQLPAQRRRSRRAVRARQDQGHRPRGQVPRPLDPRPQGPSPSARCAQRHLELGRERSDARDHPRRRPFRPARCRGSGDPDDGRLADAVEAFEEKSMSVRSASG